MQRYVPALFAIAACLLVGPMANRQESCYRVWSRCYDACSAEREAYGSTHTCKEAERWWWGPNGMYGGGGRYDACTAECRDVESECLYERRTYPRWPVMAHCLAQSDWGVEWTLTIVVLREDPVMMDSRLDTYRVDGAGMWPQCRPYDEDRDRDVDLDDAWDWLNDRGDW